MDMLKLIEKKKRGEALTDAQIHELIAAYVRHDIPDYQMSAFLMAVWFQGMTMPETLSLCDAMIRSGETMDLSSIEGIACDKHSSGGVGDKTTLVLAPLVSACGAAVAKMSGRGLGHTGGTIDKLESIPGLRTDLDPDAFCRQVKEIRLAISAQSGRLVPADGMLYALRDVSGTVDSLPLIASSIMSKKIAAGCGAILLDVKYGEGAFMRERAQAEELCACMKEIGRHFGRDVQTVLSDMNDPLGNAIGNILEVKEAIMTLRGEGPQDLQELCEEEGAIMLMQAHIAADEQSGRAMIRSAIRDGSGLCRFREMVIAQGGDVRFIDEPQRFAQAPCICPLYSRKSGTIQQVHALAVGTLAMELGAGRRDLQAHIDPRVGIVLKHKKGDMVRSGEALAEVHAAAMPDERWLRRLQDAFAIR